MSGESSEQGSRLSQYTKDKAGRTRLAIESYYAQVKPHFKLN